MIMPNVTIVEPIKYVSTHIAERTTVVFGILSRELPAEIFVHRLVSNHKTITVRESHRQSPNAIK